MSRFVLEGMQALVPLVCNGCWVESFAYCSKAREAQIQKEQQKVEKKFSNFDPIDGDLPDLIHSKTRRIWQWGGPPWMYHELPSKSYLFLKSRFSRHGPHHCLTTTVVVPSNTKNQSDQNKTFRDVLGGLWVLGRMVGHEFHALLIFQKFLIADDFAALFGISTHLDTEIIEQPLSPVVEWFRHEGVKDDCRADGKHSVNDDERGSSSPRDGVREVTARADGMPGKHE